MVLQQTMGFYASGITHSNVKTKMTVATRILSLQTDCRCLSLGLLFTHANIESKTLYDLLKVETRVQLLTFRLQRKGRRCNVEISLIVATVLLCASVTLLHALLSVRKPLQFLKSCMLVFVLCSEMLVI